MSSPRPPAPTVVYTLNTVGAANAVLKSRADLSYRLFDALELNGIVARQSIFPGAVFRKCSIRDCDFSRSDFEGVRFESCTLENVSFEDADIRSTQFSECQLRDCNFVGSYFAKNLISGGEWERCHLDRSTLLNNSFRSCVLRNVSNQVSTILHSDFVRVSFDKVALSNCTCLYTYFEHCEFGDFEINADAVGLSYGLPASALPSTRLIFLGRTEPTPPPDQIVNQLLSEFATRGWLLHALLTELNFVATDPLREWQASFDYFAEEASRGRVVKVDDAEFVLHIAERAAAQEKLPLFSVIAAYDNFTALLDNVGTQERDMSTIEEIATGIEKLLSTMEERYLAGARELTGADPERVIAAEFCFHMRPALPPSDSLRVISNTLLNSPHVPELIETRPGSWIEVIRVTLGTMLSVYAMLYLVEGYIVRLTMIRARYANLVQTKLPKSYVDRARDPRHDPTRELIGVLATVYGALARGALPLSVDKNPLGNHNLEEIRVDEPPSPT